MNNALDIQSVYKNFRAKQENVAAVDGVSLQIRENEFFTLLGPSGCGKTTLLRMIAGLETIDRGQIILNGEDITSIPAHERPVNTVFQNYALFPHMSVAQNISFGLKMKGNVPAPLHSEIVRNILNVVDMQGLQDRMPSALSGGQQQRVALARALVNHPKVLLLDESLSALDFKLRKQMQMELKRLQRETGITFVFVTHDQEEAMSMSDRIAVMDKGKIVQIGSPRDIYEKPANHFIATFIGACNFIKPSSLGLTETELIGFRPEDATIDKRLPDQDNKFPRFPIPARVMDMRYQGTGTDYHLRLMTDENIIVRGNPLSNIVQGDIVTAHIDMTRLIRCST